MKQTNYAVNIATIKLICFLNQSDMPRIFRHVYLTFTIHLADCIYSLPSIYKMITFYILNA